MDSKLCSGLTSLTNGLFGLGSRSDQAPASPALTSSAATLSSTPAGIMSSNTTTTANGTDLGCLSGANHTSLSHSTYCDSLSNEINTSSSIASAEHGSPLDGRLVYTADGSPVLIPESIEPAAPPPLVAGSTSQWQPFAPAVHLYTTADSPPSTYRLFTLRQSNQLDRPCTARLQRLHSWLRQSGFSKESSIEMPLNRLLNAPEDSAESVTTMEDADLPAELSAELDHIERLHRESTDLRDDTSRLLVCFVCRRRFSTGARLSLHAQQKHHIQMLLGERYLLAKQRNLVATLQTANGPDRRPLLAFGSLLHSDEGEDGNAIEPTIGSTNSTTTAIESGETIDGNDNLLAELSDLANLEKIAKAAAAALHQPFSSSSDSTSFTNESFGMESVLNKDSITSLPSNSCTVTTNSNSSATTTTATSPTALDSANQLAATLNKNMASLAGLLPQLQQQQSVQSNQTAQQQLQQQQLQLLASVNQNALLGGNLLANAANLNQLALSMSALSANNTGPANVTTGAVTSNTSSISGQSSTIAGQHHMAMLHSRNSCKTLKCPKCNWHYKYQETLEIHMKEKHPETELNCVYCLANQPHPRLARGETYTCGYKPYRCDVCNYSTTTKGNLSIHMQSDKHINNVQELQNGNLPPEVLQNLVQQQQQQLQQQQRQQEAAAAAAVAAAQQQMTGAQLPAPTLDQRPASRQMQSPLTPSSASTRPAGSTSPGNSSLANVNPSSSPSATAIASSTASSLAGNASAGNPAAVSNNNSAVNSNGKAMWRCDVCNYETNVARNLRIHMSSEKHAHNMVLLQQNVKQMQQQQTTNALDNANNAALLQQLNPQLLAALAAAASTGNGSGKPLANGSSMESLNGTPEAAALADIAYNQAMSMMMANQQRAVAELLSGKSSASSASQQQQQQRNAMQAVATQLALLGQSSQPSQAGSAGTNGCGNGSSAAAAAVAAAQMAALNGGQMNNGQISSIGQPILDLEQPDPTIQTDQHWPNYDEHHCRLFQCVTCTVFTCDSIDLLAAHLQQDRTRGREEESLVALSGNYICKLCTYKTNLKANFQLHCKTDKHLQRVQQVNHIKEGGLNNEWKIKLIGSSNAVQVRCNLCDYYTNSLHKLQMHVANARHEASTRVFLHLQLNETLLRNNSTVSSSPAANSSSTSDQESLRFEYRCVPCNHACPSIFALLHHLNSSQHLQSENLRQLKLQLQLGQGSMIPAKSLEEEIRELFTVRKSDHCNSGPISVSHSSSSQGTFRFYSLFLFCPDFSFPIQRTSRFFSFFFSKNIQTHRKHRSSGH